jgi:hypothetical protein
MQYNIEIDSFGNKFYYKKVTFFYHREDGPAVEYKNGHKQWWINGELHRINGPAIEIPYTKWQYNEWWINGQRLSPEKETVLNRWWNNKNDKNTM